jgi:NAD(P)-dependent dehydrogenase (short-subunit alcohol dehydrogenase family)
MPTSADAHRSGDRLAGRTVLLQGATGTVGSAVLRRLCDQGANVAVAVRKDWQVRRLKAALPPASAVGLVPSGDAEAAAGLVKGVEDWLGPIDALIATISG